MVVSNEHSIFQFDETMSGSKYCPLIFILWSVCDSISELIIENKEFTHSNNTQLKGFVSYYMNHSFVIHNNALDDLNIAQFVTMLATYHMVGQDNTLIKPGAKNTINIFFIQNVSSIEIYPYTLKVFNEDGCNLFLTKEISQKICSIEIVKLAPASFVFDVKSNHLFSCFTENEEVDLTLVSDEKLNNLHRYHRSFRNLGGRKIKVYFLNNQATICRKIVNGYVDLVRNGTCNPIGAEANLVRTLGKKFNFTPEFRIFQYKTPETKWTEIIDAVGRSEAEFGVGSLILAADEPVYYTTFTQISAEFVVLYVNPTKQLNLAKILITFDLIVYVIAVVSLIVIMILTIVFTYLFKYREENGRFIFILLKMIVEQGSNISAGLYSFITMKLVIFLWLYFTIIFCSVIKSQIASILIKPETYDFRSIEDLSHNDFGFALNTGLKNKFLATYGWLGMKIVEMGTRNYQDVREIKKCVNLFPRDKVNDLRFFTDRNIYYALAMNPLSPYRKQFTLNIDQLKSSGIMTNWYEYVSRSVLKRLSQEQLLPRPLRIDQTSSFFILLLVGLGIGFSVLILEIIEAVLNRKYDMNFTFMDKL